MTGALLDQFIAEEVDDVVVAQIRQAVAAASGERYLTFDRFNVRIDLDEGQATIEDELDPDEEVTMGLAQFLERLGLVA